jgi:hypothetical protein
MKVMGELQDCHCRLAAAILEAVATSLGLSPTWFAEEYGELPPGLQWHVKRYVPTTLKTGEGAKGGHTSAELSGERATAAAAAAVGAAGAATATAAGMCADVPVAVVAAAAAAASHLPPSADTIAPNNPGVEDVVLLPTHTDPSLISIVVNDTSSTTPVQGAQGLQCLNRGGTRGYSNVGFSGGGVVTVFVGSVLDKITGGVFPGCKHRVVEVPPLHPVHLSSVSVGDGVNNPYDSGAARVAATFFFRPANPRQMLTGLPSSDIKTSVLHSFAVISSYRLQQLGLRK